MGTFVRIKKIANDLPLKVKQWFFLEFSLSSSFFIFVEEFAVAM
jgi:hypothetical protein